MPHRILKGEDGLYHVKGKSYKMLIGSRQCVGHGTAYKTSGKLTKSDLIQTKDGRWKSLSKHKSAKKEKRLETIYSKLNLFRLMKPGTNLFGEDLAIQVQFPFTLTTDIVRKLLKLDQQKSDHMMYM